MNNAANMPDTPEDADAPEEVNAPEDTETALNHLTRSDFIALIIAGLVIYVPIIFFAAVPARWRIWAAIIGLLLWLASLFVANRWEWVITRRFGWRITLILLASGVLVGISVGHYALPRRQVIHSVKIVHRVKIVHQAPPKTPGIGVLTALISEEALASVHHNVGRAVSIYAPGAVITDAGCEVSAGGGPFTGTRQITARYQALRKFSWLQHVNVHDVTWTPDGPDATQATALSESIGLIKPRNPSHSPQFVASGDKWTFTKIGNKWLIMSLAYNLCIPADGGG